MMTRRTFVSHASSLGAGLVASSCSSVPNYKSLADDVWSASPSGGEFAELVHFAVLGANSHNAQAWSFAGNEKQLIIAPDLTRALPAADPDNHHLYASLGCAAENLMLAASNKGFSSSLTFMNEGSGNVVVDLANNGTTDPLFNAIPHRQCTRSEYDGKVVPTAELQSLAAAGNLPGIELLLITDKTQIERIGELIVIANTTQLADEKFVAELESWIRFSEYDAITSRDGLYAACSGNMTMPGWFGRTIFNFALSADSENDKYLRQVRSSAGLAVFVSEKNDEDHWIRAGRAFQRFALQATALNIRQAFVNQPVEVQEVRRELASLLGLGDRRADFIVRFGYGPLMPRSLRRSLKDVTTA